MASSIAVASLCLLCLILLERPYSRNHPDLRFALNLAVIAGAVVGALLTAFFHPALEIFDRVLTYLAALVLLCFGTLKAWDDWVATKQRIEEEKELRKELDRLDPGRL